VRRRRALPLHTRLSLVFGGLMALVVCCLLGVWLWSSSTYDRQLRARLNQDVARHLAEHAVPLRPEGVDEDELKGMFMHVMSVNPALEVYLLDGAGEILAYDAPEGHVRMSRIDLGPAQAFLAGDGEVLGDDPRAPGTRSPISVWPVSTGEGALGYVYVVVGGEAWRATAGPLRGFRQRTVVAAAGLGLLAIGILASVLFARRLTRPLRQLHDSIGSEERRPLPKELREADDEIGELARTYAHMSKRIREQVEYLERTDEDRREFVASVSHDLRTPLASLQGYLELLDGEHQLDDVARAEYLTVARRRALHLSHLVEQLFDLAKLEGGDILPRPEHFNLAELTQDVLQGLRPRAAQHGIKLVCRMPRELPEVNADLGLMERAVSNLLDNALKYTGEGGEVSVQLQRREHSVRWSVRDDGPGIAESDLPHIFESRFRGDGRRLAPGTGLGLAITRRVLELHDSAIAVESATGEGSEFCFELQTA